MDILRIAGIALLSVVAVLIVKQHRSEIAMMIGISASVVILLLVIQQIAGILDAFADIAENTGLESALYGSILRIIGIGYITEFTANICDDAGAKSIADKVLLAGKVIILVLALPILLGLIEIVSSIINLA
ncbi:MAG: stage III sporulation protein AD [Firmicutes bacterium]|nr:stage III sporulation protein AD [Bacillota bacterium]